MSTRDEPAKPIGNTVQIAEVLKDERDLLGLGKSQGSSHASAICFSGGGIRSATFCLGVLQGLAKLGRLRDFHFLSTVSGGSYIGAWLSAWIARADADSRRASSDFDDPADLDRAAKVSGLELVSRELARSVASGTSERVGTCEPSPIKRLRAYSSFLSPVRGFSADFLSALAILARNLVLNWIVVVPIILAILLLPRLFNALIAAIPHGPTKVISFPELCAPLVWTVASLLVFLAVAFASYGVQITKSLTRPTALGKPSSLGVNCLFVAPLSFAAFAFVYANRAMPLASFNPEHLIFGQFDAQTIAIVAGTVVHALASLLGASLCLREESSRRIKGDRTPYAALALNVAASAATGAVAGALIYFILSRMTEYQVTTSTQTMFAVPMVLASLGIASVLRAGLSMRFAGEETREWWARASAHVARVAFGWLILSLLVIQLPEWILGWAATWSALAAGVTSAGGVLLTIATAAIGFWSKHGADLKEKAKGAGQLIGIRAIELAALASIIVIAVAASLLLGVALTQPPFMDKEHIAEGKTRLQGAMECSVLIDRAKTLAEKQCGRTKPACVTVQFESKPLPLAEAACAGLIPENQEQMKSDGSGVLVIPESKKPTTSELLSGLFEKEGENNFAAHWLIKHRLSMELSNYSGILLLLLALISVSTLASILFGANAFSLNAFYGNRLTRAYLGASQRRSDQHPDPFTGFDTGDNLPLKDLGPNCLVQNETNDADARRVESFPQCPLIVINTALNLIQPSGERLEWQERKAASFFMTPRYCGSDVVGFVPTAEYGSSPNGVSVGRAMAISGAAASPSMGYHSSAFVSMLMAFFNVRLGWWMPNPKVPSVQKKEEPGIGLGPVLTELTSGAGEKTRFVYLSDGGHFENLGLYEMVRRRCRKILVVDAAYDPQYEYEDLENAIRKIRTDFGIEITFDELLHPGKKNGPGGHCCFGRIHYRKDLTDEGGGFGDDQEEDGEILLIKPILTGDEPVDVLRYAATSRSDGRVFPQQPTSDEFFDEAQFESYRKLGLHSILESFPGKNDGWPKPAPESASNHPFTASVESAKEAPPTSRWLPEIAQEKGTGGVLSMLGSMAPMSQAAMLASAITITAAISVTGTVALSNPELTLKNPGSLTAVLGEESGQAIAKGVDAYFNGPDKEGTTRHQALLGELNEQLKKLTEISHVVEVNLVGEPDPEWTEFARHATAASGALSKAISDLETASGNLNNATRNIDKTTGTFMTSLDGAIKNLNGAVIDMKKTVVDLGTDASAIKSGLVEITVRLKAIETKVQSISPRQTVRGNGS
jgi:hypothetical protein